MNGLHIASTIWSMRRPVLAPSRCNNTHATTLRQTPTPVTAPPPEPEKGKYQLKKVNGRYALLSN